ncbi:hypothetical protein [Thiomonas sp.]
MSGLDLQLAWIRRAGGDLRVFTNALANQLETALPNLTTVVRRKNGLFSKTTHVRSIEIRTDPWRFHLEYDGSRLTASRAQAVHGVTLRTGALPLDEWLRHLQTEVSRLSGELQGADQALHDFLLR